MRTVELNGYIDEEAWFGDEVTPESLHALLYPEGADAQEDLRIILNSYGGSCNAAVRMFDDLREMCIRDSAHPARCGREFHSCCAPWRQRGAICERVPAPSRCPPSDTRG